MSKPRRLLTAAVLATCAPLGHCYSDEAEIRFRACIWAEEAAAHGIDPRYAPAPAEHPRPHVIIVPTPAPSRR